MQAFIAPLFVPASRPDRFEKAANSVADAIIIDLEDAVPPNLKNAARENLRFAQSLKTPVFVRCNGEGAPWHDADLVAMAELGLKRVCAPKVAGRFLPRPWRPPVPGADPACPMSVGHRVARGG
jgi:citrate lyase beta subunit